MIIAATFLCHEIGDTKLIQYIRSHYIKSKIAVGNKYYYALGPILKRRSISQSIKICLYKPIIRPAVTYGADMDSDK
jgi:hypothetical protein